MYKQIASNKRKSALFIFLFVVLILAIGYIFGYVTDYGYSLVVLAGIIAIGYGLIGYYAGDKFILFISGAKEVTRENARPIYNLVENLCIASGLPVPKIYVIPDPSPNAFATGRDPKHASLALTSGLIEKLEKVELEGVVAHELSHIQNFDIRLASIVVMFVGMVVLLSNWFLRAGRFGFGGRRREREGGNLGLILFLVGLVLAIFAPLIARLIQFAISRKREFLADASSALMTRYPEGLARALEKISQDPHPLQRVNNTTAHLYISDPVRQRTSWIQKLYATHPPIEERIKALRNM